MSETNTTGAPAPAFTDADLLKALRYVTDLFEAEEMPLNARKCRAAADRLEEVSAQNAALKEALRFYADPEIYKPHPHGLAFDRRDLSWRARTALKEAGDAA